MGELGSSKLRFVVNAGRTPSSKELQKPLFLHDPGPGEFSAFRQKTVPKFRRERRTKTMRRWEAGGCTAASARGASERGKKRRGDDGRMDLLHSLG